jgi:hypothetical protein
MAHSNGGAQLAAKEAAAAESTPEAEATGSVEWTDVSDTAADDRPHENGDGSDVSDIDSEQREQ